MSTLLPRAVLVRRSTDFELLLARHATRGQAEFFLRSRGQTLEAVERDHECIHAATERVLGAIPSRWRRASVRRDDLSRFLFEPEDLVVAVGQDGLVANIAKYVDRQPVLGVNPLPDRYDGVLVRFTPDDATSLLVALGRGHRPELQRRTMVEATLDDGQALLALNEIFVGHRSHQSARYRIAWEGHEERQSSSGLIVASGTGSTGWARSINISRAQPLSLPAPSEDRLAFFVREAFPSRSTGTSITRGICDRDRALQLTSEMNDGGVIFGDGIERDFLAFDFGQRLRIGIAERRLHLVLA